jgi:hypothetical protein
MFSCTNSRLNPDGTKIIDNELFTDSCIAMEDGSPPWLSPDIILTSSLGVADEARKGENNTVAVRARKSCNPASTTNVLVELWVANPSLNFAPNVNSIKVFEAVVQTTSFVLNSAIDPMRPVAQVSRTWTADETLSNTVPTDADPLRLHRCFVARSYPSNLTPPDAKFCVTEDPHVAQRNIAIVKVPAGQRVRRLSFPIETTIGNREFAEAAMVRVIADRVPSTAVLKAILPSLKQFAGFRQIAQVAPERFSLQVSEKFSPVIRDSSRLEKVTPINPGDISFQDKWRFVLKDGLSFERFRDAVFNPEVVLQSAVAARKFNAAFNVRSLEVSPELRVAPTLQLTRGLEKLVEQAAPTFEADIKLPPKEVANFTFTADLPEKSQPGDAHIFHVMHINDQKQVIGGLTIVAVVG